MAVGQQLNVVAIVRSGETGSAFHETSIEMNGTKMDVHVGRLQDVHPDVEIFDQVDVLLLEVDPSDSDELAALSTIISERFPKTPVVATAANASLQDVRQLMRLGVVDVVPQPVTANDLSTAIEFAMRTRQRSDDGESGRGKIISFLKAGGGVGSTTLIVQSGYLLTEGYSAEEPAVCIVDLDLQYGNASLYMDIDNRVGLMDVAESPERLDVSLFQGVLGYHDTGLRVLAAPRDLMPLESMTATTTEGCLKVAADAYRFVLVDLPNVWTSWTQQALQNSDMIVLVTQLTVPHVRQARRQLDALASHGLSEIPTKILVNRFEKAWGRGVTAKEAGKAMNRDIEHFIISDFKTVSEAINQGVPLSKIARRTKVEKSIREFSDSLVRDLTGVESRSEPRLRIGFSR